MSAMAILSYVAGITAFVLVSWLLRGRVADELALGIGWLAMLLVGFPFTRYLTVKGLTFTRWMVFTTLAAFAGTVVFIAMRSVI